MNQENLKTLKEIKFDFKITGNIHKEKIGAMQEIMDEIFISKSTLRLEAIKWINFIESGNVADHVRLPWFGDHIQLNSVERDGARIVLQAFFNIREEDLK